MLVGGKCVQSCEYQEHAEASHCRHPYLDCDSFVERSVMNHRFYPQLSQLLMFSAASGAAEAVPRHRGHTHSGTHSTCSDRMFTARGAQDIGAGGCVYAHVPKQWSGRSRGRR